MKNEKSKDLASTLSLRSLSLPRPPHVLPPPFIHLLFILSRPLHYSTATITIGAGGHSTVLTAHAAVIIHMLTQVFQGHQVLTRSTTVHVVHVLTPVFVKGHQVSKA